MLSPAGRIGRQSFIVGFLIFAGFYVLQSIWFARTGVTGLNFWLWMLFLFVNLQIIFAVYGKRLHDLGRSFWPIIALFALIIIAAIILMLKFGGLDYFDTLMNDPVITEDPERMRALHDAYQSDLARGMPYAQPIFYGLPLIFTLWLAMQKGERAENRYGPPQNEE